MVRKGLTERVCKGTQNSLHVQIQVCLLVGFALQETQTEVSVSDCALSAESQAHLLPPVLSQRAMVKENVT